VGVADQRMHCIVGWLGIFLRGFLFRGTVGLGMAGRGVTLVLRTLWFNRSSWIRAKEIIAIRVESSMGVLKPIEPLNSISLEVDGSNLHPCSVGGSVEPKIALRARDPSDRVSFFPSWEVHLHAWIILIRDDVSMLLRIISPI
ncbi:hypothetical protein GW17_00039466, partial [Ensete ventricosum]